MSADDALRAGIALRVNELKITFLVEALRLARRHGVDVELDTAAGTVRFKRRAKATTAMVWQPYGKVQLTVQEA